MKKPRTFYLVLAAALLCAAMAWYVSSRVTAGNRKLKTYRLKDIAIEIDAHIDFLRIGCLDLRDGLDAQTDEVQVHRNLETVAEFIRQEKLDIVMLTNVDFQSSRSARTDQARVLARLARMPFVLEQRNTDYSLPFHALRTGNAILSRFPLEEARLLDLPGGSFWRNLFAGRPSGAVCRAATPQGALRLVATGLEPNAQKNPGQLADAMRPAPGDAPPASILFAAGTPAPAPGMSEDVVPILVHEDAFKTMRSSESHHAWILCSREVRLLGYDDAHLALPRHRPVTAQISLQPLEERFTFDPPPELRLPEIPIVCTGPEHEAATIVVTPGGDVRLNDTSVNESELAESVNRPDAPKAFLLFIDDDTPWATVWPVIRALTPPAGRTREIHAVGLTATAEPACVPMMLHPADLPGVETRTFHPIDIHPGYVRIRDEERSPMAIAPIVRALQSRQPVRIRLRPGEECAWRHLIDAAGSCVMAGVRDFSLDAAQVGP